MNRPWLFDTEILCPMCGGHQIKYSDMSCPKFGQTIPKDYFIILKFMELEYKINELKKLIENEKMELRGPYERGGEKIG